MNFLAHLLTGDAGDEMLVGSFAGDFCRGRIERHPTSLRRGIRLHRMVDAFADEHPSFSSLRALLRPDLGLYAAVAADMLIDHLLALRWNQWVRNESLEAFAERTGHALRRGAGKLPRAGSRVAMMMTAGRWLESYARRDGIITALERMSARARRGVRLVDAISVMDRHGDQVSALTEDFLGDLFSSEELISAGMRDDIKKNER